MDSTSIGLRLGDTRATVDTIGVRMLYLRVGDADLTQPVTASTRHEYYNGVVLAPWPNRVRGGRWRLSDDVHQLDITEPARGGALHGLLSFADYRVLERSDDAVTLGGGSRCSTAGRSSSTSSCGTSSGQTACWSPTPRGTARHRPRRGRSGRIRTSGSERTRSRGLTPDPDRDGVRR